MFFIFFIFFVLYLFIFLSSSLRASSKEDDRQFLKTNFIKKNHLHHFQPFANLLKFSLARLQTQRANKDIRSIRSGQREKKRERDIQRPVFTVFTCPRGPVSGPVITRGRVGVIGSVRRPRPHMPPACLPAKTDEPRAIHIFPGFTAILPRLRGYRHSPSGRPLLCLLPVIAGSISGRGWPISISRRDRVRVLTSSVVHMEFL